jgi:TolB-like protein
MATREILLGTMTLQPGRQLLSAGGPIALSRKPLAILSTLAEARGELVTKDELMRAVWPNQVVEESALHVHIVALRKVLGAEAGRLKTVHGFGYRLEVPVQEEAPNHGPAQTSPSAIAVLPFANLTGDPARDYFADGMAEELLAALSRVAGLKVPSRTSSFAYRNRAVDIREIGAQLGVSAVVEGSVRVGDDRIRLTIQLIDAATGFHIWSENFDRAVGDLLALQDELAHAVAAALGRELKRGAPATTSAEAMALLLQARAVAGRLTDEGFLRAAALLREAIALDPGFAAAHESLAGVLLMGISAGTLPHQLRDEARRGAEHALALDPDLPIALGLVGCVEALAGNWSAAEENFQAAFCRDEAEPRLHEAFTHYVLLPTGQLRRARRHAERAQALAPARARSSFLAALCAAMRGDVRAASDLLDMAVLLGIAQDSPSFRKIHAYCLAAAGRFEEAGAEVAASLPAFARAAGGEAVVASVYGLFTGGGDPAVVRRQIIELFEACRDSPDFLEEASLPSNMFGWLAFLGALDEAYRIVEAVVERSRATGYFSAPVLAGIWFPLMAAFRSDARFQVLVGELGMPDYWARVGPPDGYVVQAGRLIPG